MPIIAAFNPKGGCAKSTAILVIADALERKGATVSIIDTDPQGTIVHWRAGNSASKIRVVEERQATRIHRVIREEAATAAFVFVDMAGFASDMRTPVMSRADLALVPLQAKPEDARRAAEALAYIASDSETLRRPIKTRLLWARTVPKMVTRVERRILKEIGANEIPTLTTHLNERSAFAAMILDQCSLAELDAGAFNGVEKAIENADDLANEVVSVVIENQEKGEAA